MLTGTVRSNGTLSAKVSTGVYEKTELKYYNSMFEFPNIGEDDYLYLDREKNKSYRWDSSQLRYICVGSDYEDIGIIEGGSANE